MVFCYSSLNGLRHVPKHIFQISFNAHWQNSASPFGVFAVFWSRSCTFPSGLGGKELDLRLKARSSVTGIILWGVSLFSGNCHKWRHVKVLCKWRLVALSGMLNWEIDNSSTTTASWESQGVGEFRIYQIHLAQMLPSKSQWNTPLHPEPLS